MWPDRVSNPGHLTCKSGALPTALRGPAESKGITCNVLLLWIPAAVYTSSCVYHNCQNFSDTQPFHYLFNKNFIEGFVLPICLLSQNRSKSENGSLIHCHCHYWKSTCITQVSLPFAGKTKINLTIFKFGNISFPVKRCFNPTALRTQWPKLYGVLANLSAIGLSEFANTVDPDQTAP